MKKAPPASEAKSSRSGKLFIIDGNSFLYRAYYAIGPLSNSKGEPTNALYGFMAMMRKLLADMKPESMAICWDRKEPTFRHDKYEDYKKHRKPMPEDLVQQIQPIKEYCRLSRYAMFEKAGFEADDLIGTLAVRGASEGYEIFIVTGDKDAMQLVNNKVKILMPHKDNLIIDAAGVKKRFDGLGPEKVVDIMALMGDASDNIPGVRGIGEKTALKLISQFGSVETLLKNVGRVSSKSQQALIKEHQADLELSRELAKIDTDVPFECTWDDMLLGESDRDALAEFCQRYELRGFLKDLPQAAAGAKAEEEQKDRRYETVGTLKELEALAAKLKKAGVFSFDTETTSEDPMRAHLVGMSFSWEAFHAAYVPVASKHHQGPGLPLADALGILKPLLENEKLGKYGQNIKYDWIMMKRQGVDLTGIVFDTMIASHLINPAKRNHNLDDISMEFLGVQKITTDSLLGTGKNRITMDQVPVEKVSEYASEDADCVFRLVSILEPRLKENDLEKVFRDVELPLLEVLGRMEMNGVSLDLGMLKKLSDATGKELENLTRAIYEDAGQEFNINSTKQLAEILFDKLKLPVVRKTKTGNSTDVSVLEKLAEKYELPKKLLDYRERAKLKSTYLDALPEIINSETGLVHTSYHQATTATGRLSSSDPNLQNIPIRTEAGRLIRKAFVPRPGGKRRFLAADYSQIELRILGHLTGDENLVKAFREDRDIHKFTATLLYGVKETEVTRPMRDVAKVINFSIIYGKTAYGLSQDLGISISEADGFIENYFKRYKAVRDYLEAQKEMARKNGYLTTILGRRAYFPDINAKNVQMRQFAERAAINAPIQGSAADLVKLAMLAIQKRLDGEKRESLMILQVHDELVFDAPESEVEKLKSLVKHEMENAFPMRVPIVADVFTGENWYKG